YSSADADGPFQLCINRIRPDGRFDSSFTVANGFRGAVSRIVGQPGGQILVAGQFRTHVGGPTVSLARLNFGGTEDADFPLFLWFNPNRNIVISQNGSIVTQSDFGNSLIRFLPDTGAPVITANPKSIRRLPGAALQLNVSSSGAPNLQLQWLRNGFPVSGANDSTLLLTSLSATTTGDYKAVVTNDNGSVESTIATVSFNTAPFFGNIANQILPPFPQGITFLVPFSDAESLPQELSLTMSSQTSPNFSGQNPSLFRSPDGISWVDVPRFTANPADSWAWVDITLNGADPDDGFASTTFRVANRDPHYSEWAAQFFSQAQLADPNIGGTGGDPNHNGVSNLLEYARGSNPAANDPSRDP